MSSIEPDNSSKKRARNTSTGLYVDFIAGCIGGISGTVVGQPFDTVKVRLQTQGSNRLYKSGVDCARQILKAEGVYGLYKGLIPPIAGQAGINAVIFGVQGTVMRFSDAGLSSEIIAGCMAGAAQTLIICPVELIKTKLQIQGRGQRLKNSSGYRGPLSFIVKITKQEGVVGLFRGMTATLLRDIPAFGLYFGIYYCLMKHLTPVGGSFEDVSSLKVMLAGGLTGMASWVYSYPTDVIKSKIQAEGFVPIGRYKGYADCIRESVREEGYRVFVRGMTVCVLRAFPVNAATFAAVEASLAWMNP